MINVEHMLATLNHVTNHPEQLDLDVWGERTACGTVLCFAGHAAVLAGGELIWDAGEFDPDATTSQVRLPDGDNRSIRAYAGEVLGLEYWKADVMFYRTRTIADLWCLAHQFTDGAIPLPPRERVPASPDDNYPWATGELV